MNTNRTLIVGAAILALAVIGYYLLAPEDTTTPPKATTSETTQPAQPKAK